MAAATIDSHLDAAENLVPAGRAHTAASMAIVLNFSLELKDALKMD